MYGDTMKSEPTEESPETPEETTATLPSGLFPGGVKAGDTISLRVVNVFDGEVEVAVAGDVEAEGEEPTMSADAELDQMAME